MSPNITHDSFKFRQKSTAKRRRPGFLRRTVKRTPLAIPAPTTSSPSAAASTTSTAQDVLLSPTTDTSNLPQIFTKYVICFDKDAQDPKLLAVAEGFGATVKTDMDRSMTHLIIEPRGDRQKLKVVKQAIQKGIICVSKQWLVSCYHEKRNCPAFGYQFGVDPSSKKMLNIPNAEDEFMAPNPFDTEYIDFDELEANKPLDGGQMRLDRYISRTKNEHTEIEQDSRNGTRESTVEPVLQKQSGSTGDSLLNESSSVSSSSTGSINISSNYHSYASEREHHTLSSATNIASMATTVSGQEGVEPDEMRAKRAAKLAYMEEQKIRLAERKRRLEEARKSREKEEPQKKRIPSRRIDYSEDEVRVWYGEKPFNPQTGK